MRKCKLNEKAFDVLDETASYWLGFLTCNSQISRTSGHSAYKIKLSMRLADKYHLLRYRDFIGSDHAIVEHSYVNKGKLCTECSLSVHSQILFERLHDLGVRPKKRLNNFVHPSMELDLHFWRGAFDASGAFSISLQRGRHLKPTMQFFANESIVNKFEDLLQAAGITERQEIRLTHHAEYDSYVSSLGAKRSVRRAHELLYDHDFVQDAVVLERQQDYFEGDNGQALIYADE